MYIESDSKSDQTSHSQVSKYTELLASMVALAGSVVVFMFFTSINVNPASSSKIYIAIKPGYSSWAWGIFSISSALYYYIRSKRTTTTGGYINPIFSNLIKIMQIIPFVGLMLSWIGGAGNILQGGAWKMIIRAASGFLDSILILFVVANFGAGVSGVRRLFFPSSRKNHTSARPFDSRM